MIVRTHYIALVIALVLVGLIVELIRRRQLHERYALLWLLVAVLTAVAAVSQKAISSLAWLAGIYYPPAALLLMGFIFLMVLMMHFSVVISRLSEQNKLLAQEVALMRQQISGDGGQEAESAGRKVSDEVGDSEVVADYAKGGLRD